MDVIKDKSDRAKFIMLAHGSRDSNWCDIFEQGLKVINSCLPENASLAYMEMAEPSLENVIGTHYLTGVRKFNVLPLFFAEGRHLLHDVPRQIEALHKQYTGVDIKLLDAVGRQDEFWQGLGTMIAQLNVEQNKSTQILEGQQA